MFRGMLLSSMANLMVLFIFSEHQLQITEQPTSREMYTRTLIMNAFGPRHARSFLGFKPHFLVTREIIHE